MTIREIYNKNITLQNISKAIVRAVFVQNHDTALRHLGWLSGELSKYVDSLNEQKDNIYGKDLAVSFEERIAGIGSFFGNIIAAQQAEDYILIADLLEMQLVPFLLDVQEDMRNTCDLFFCQENWDYNIKLLRKKDAKLAELVEAEKERWLNDEFPMYQLEPTNSGLFTLASEDAKGRYYFHSNLNPQQEAVAFAERYYTVEEDCYAVLGLGLGYHCAALAGKDEGIRVNIYENSLAVILQAMLANELTWLWNNERIRLIYDKDFTRLSRQLGAENTLFVIHYPSLRHVKNASVRDKMNQFFIRDSGIRNTRALMDSNFKENIKHYTGLVDELRERFEGKRAIIVAAGPSLDRNVKLLLDKPDDVIIIATETVFRKLTGLGVKIDYVIVSDASSRIYGHMTGMWNSQVPMLYLSTTCRAFARDYSGDCYIILQKDYERSVEAAEQLGADTYSTGGSVSTVALDVCIRLGCSSIAFVGLDLAYTGNLAHAEGTARRVANDIDDMPKVDGYEFGFTPDGKYRVKKAKVPSSNVFNMYRHWMEKRIKEQDVKIPIYDASEGGSIIDGMEIVPLKTYLNELLEQFNNLPC